MTKNDLLRRQQPVLFAEMEAEQTTSKILRGLLGLLDAIMPSVSHTEFKVFYAIARRGWERKPSETNPIGHREIQKATGLSLKQVCRCAATLEKKNFIHITRDTRPTKGTHQGPAPNEYYITGHTEPPAPRRPLQMPAKQEATR